MDTVRIPISLLPYEDQSAVHKKQLRAQRKLLAAERDSQADAEEEEEDDAILTAVSEAQEAEDGKDSTTVQTQQRSTSPPTGNSDQK